jgi:DNA-binding CsgD family transcriptional regulator
MDRGELVAAIYEAGVDPEKWPHTLGRIREALGGEATCLFSRDSTLAMKRADCFAYEGYTPEVLDDYQEYYGSVDTRTRLVAACADGAVYVDDRQMSFADVTETEIFQDFFRPLRLGYGMASPLFKGSGRHGVLSVHRPLAASNFSSRSIELFEYLAPHVVRALQVNRQIQRARTLADSLSVTLDHFPTAVLIVSIGGNVLHMNAKAERLIRDTSCPIGVKNNKLFAELPSDTDQIRRQIERASGLGHEASDAPVALLNLTSQTTLQRYGVMVAPVRNGAAIGMLSEAGVIVFISEPSRSDHMDIPVLIKEFGLTPAEARLANSLVAGHSLAEIAESKEISIETARSLLKRAMAKTDTRSQAHLIGKLYRSLAWLHRE